MNILQNMNSKKENIKNYYINKSKINHARARLITKQIEMHRELGKNDIIYRILNSLTSRATSVLGEKKLDILHSDLIGCTLLFLKEYLLSKFEENMSFENYGEWEVDHIIPISSFNFSIEKNIYACFNYLNLQPLWKIDNRMKYNKLSINE